MCFNIQCKGMIPAVLLLAKHCTIVQWTFAILTTYMIKTRTLKSTRVAS